MVHHQTLFWTSVCLGGRNSLLSAAMLSAHMPFPVPRGRPEASTDILGQCLFPPLSQETASRILPRGSCAVPVVFVSKQG